MLVPRADESFPRSSIHVVTLTVDSTKNIPVLTHCRGLFFNWPVAHTLPDQPAQRTVQTLKDDVFFLVGPTHKLHPEQGHNFENHLLQEQSKAFVAKKSFTTPYHTMGRGFGGTDQEIPPQSFAFSLSKGE